MNAKVFERLPILAAMLLVVLVVAACAMKLHGDAGQIDVGASADSPSNSFASKLAECRSVTYERKEALSECRKVWAEKRREFLGQRAPAASDTEPVQPGSSLFVRPRDESRLPSGYPTIQQTGKE